MFSDQGPDGSALVWPLGIRIRIEINPRSGSALKPVFRIRINFLRIRIRIQRLRLVNNTDPDTDPDPIRIQGFNDQKFKKNYS
jgi:hypothetical protein